MIPAIYRRQSINTLLTGGARSGKSTFAEKLARETGERVLFVATAEAKDDEMRERIEQHKRNRSKKWRTLEVQTNIGREILSSYKGEEVILVDCLTLLCNNILCQHMELNRGEVNPAVVENEIENEIYAITDCFARISARFIIVTNEVGLGVIPVNNMARFYRDVLGRANQILASNVDCVIMMVAGLPLKLK
jgi:adenosylcobinamide kinase/adenosylcobinamide-phosphate guanylyltransferase